jgi:hypothetical protein
MQRGLISLLICFGLIGAGGWGAGCYLRSQPSSNRVRPNVLSEAEAERLIATKFAPYGIKFISNMRLQRAGIEFLVDGFDRDMQIGYIYRSHEGGDFKGEDNQREDALSNQDIEMIKSNQANFREYFLIVQEGSRADVEQATDEFIRNLFALEVLKKKGTDTKKDLGPTKVKQGNEAIPWDASGDLKRKRKEMEAKEAAKSANQAKPSVPEQQKINVEPASETIKEKAPSVLPPPKKQGQTAETKKGTPPVPESILPAKEPADQKKKVPTRDDWGAAEDENF